MLKVIPRSLTSLLFAFAATLSYIAGFASGAVFFLILGGLFELAFWVKLLRAKGVDVNL